MFCTQCVTPSAVCWGSSSLNEMESRPWWSILAAACVNECGSTCCVYLCVEMYHILSLTQLLQVWVSSVCSEGQSCSERSWHLCWLLYTQDWICKGKRQEAAAVTSRSSCKVQALCAALQSHSEINEIRFLREMLGVSHLRLRMDC